MVMSSVPVILRDECRNHVFNRYRKGFIVTIIPTTDIMPFLKQFANTGDWAIWGIMADYFADAGDDVGDTLRGKSNRQGRKRKTARRNKA